MPVRTWGVPFIILAVVLAFVYHSASGNTLLNEPANGSVISNGDGTFTYTPNADFNGTDRFKYQICDTNGLCSTATVTINVTPVNDAPVAVDDRATTPEDTPVTVDASANDTDIDGNLDPSSAVVLGAPAIESPPGRSSVGLVIDSEDPVFTHMGHELSKLVETDQVAITVKPTLGPVANVRRMLSRENAGLGIVPSDMLRYTERSEDPQLRQASKHLCFVMAVGSKAIHLLARPHIQRFEDLEGQRVMVGKSDTDTWVTANNLLHLMGVTPAVRFQDPPAEAIRAVLMDKADAAFIIGDAPIRSITNIRTLQDDARYAELGAHVHLLPLTDPRLVAEYPRTTVSYPGFADSVETIAVRPTLVSYNFTGRASSYYRTRCNALSTIGAMVRNRLHRLHSSGHPKWLEATWSPEVGSWQKDPCFFGDQAFSATRRTP